MFQKFLAERCRPTAEEEPENPDMVTIILFSINLGFWLTWRVLNCHVFAYTGANTSTSVLKKLDFSHL